MSEVPVVTRMPYGSIRIELPEFWNEDDSDPDICFYYFKGIAGPPTLHVRRDDFVYKPTDGRDTIKLGLIASQQNLGAPEQELFGGFQSLVEQINQPDITNIHIEPREGDSQIIRYLRHGAIDDEPAVAFWWIRGQLKGDTFTVVSFDYELLCDQAEQADTQKVMKRLDLAIREAEILSVEDARAQAASG